MHRSKLFVGLWMVVGLIVSAAGLAGAAPSTRINLTLTCDREIEGKAVVSLTIQHAGGDAGDVTLACGPQSLSGSRSVKDPQYPMWAATGVTVQGFAIYPMDGFAPSTICYGVGGDHPATLFELAAKVRCEDDAGVGVTLVAR